MRQAAYIIFSFSILFSTEFEFSQLHIPITVNGQELTHPFSGGHNRPRVQWWDWDVDGDADLFMLDVSGSIRYYQNNSTGSDYVFRIQTCSFHDIMAGDWFFLGDFDNDGDADLMTQNQSDLLRLHYYENDNDEFIDRGIATTSSGGLVASDPVMTPTFADMDNDGDLDLFTGNSVGTVTYYRSVGMVENIPQFEFNTDFWQEISIIGPSQRHGASALAFVDLDGDTDLDLAWGDFFQESLYVVWNIGTVEAAQMDNINITQQYPPGEPIVSAGQNMPSFTDIDLDGDQDLFISVLSGAFGSQTVNNFFYYENITGAQTPVFEYRTNHFLNGIDLLTYASPELYDLDQDGDLDMFIGTKSDPNQPSWSGKVHHFLNTGSPAEPYFELESESVFDGAIGYNMTITFGDLSDDGVPDAVVGDSNGMLHLFINNGDGSFSEDMSLSNIDLSGNADPELVDIDDDDDLDLLVGESNGNVNAYRNNGSYSFEHITHQFLGDLDVYYTTLETADIHADGDLDIIVGTGYSGSFIYINNNGNYVESSYQIPLLGNNVSIAANDLDADGSLDLIVGTITGGVFHLTAQGCVVGDLNNDGERNILDIVQLVDYILNTPFPDEGTYCRADVNGDENINILDIVLLISIILAE